MDKQRKKCKEKIRYKHASDAWESAAYYYVKFGKVYSVYHCRNGNQKDHFHITSHASLGDMSHIPEHLRELFKTYENKSGVSFFQKLRTFLIGGGRKS